MTTSSGRPASSSHSIQFWRLASPFLFFHAAFYGVAGIVLPVLGGTAERAGLIFGALNLGVALGAPVWTRLARVLRQELLEFSSGALALVAWTGLAQTSPAGLIPLAFLLGLVSAGLLALAPCCVTCAYPPELWTTRIARMQTWTMGGQVLGLLAASASPSPATGAIFQAAALLTAVPASLRLPPFPGAFESLVVHGPCLEPDDPRVSGVGSAGPTNLRSLTGLCIQWFLAMLGAAAVYGVYPLLMQKGFSLNTRSAALVFAVASAAGIGASVLVEALKQQLDPRRIFRIGLAVRALAALWLGFGAGVLPGWMGALAFVVFVSGWVPVAVGFNAALAERLPRESQGAALGASAVLMSVAVILGSVLGGVVAGIWGYRTMLLGSSTLLALALLGGVSQGVRGISVFHPS